MFPKATAILPSHELDSYVLGRRRGLSVTTAAAFFPSAPASSEPEKIGQSFYPCRPASKWEKRKGGQAISLRLSLIFLFSPARTHVFSFFSAFLPPSRSPAIFLNCFPIAHFESVCLSLPRSCEALEYHSWCVVKKERDRLRDWIIEQHIWRNQLQHSNNTRLNRPTFAPRYTERAIMGCSVRDNTDSNIFVWVV